MLDERTPEEWAYLAGLFAGEGCFVVKDRERVPHFEMQIKMTDQLIVEDVAQRWGGQVTLARRGTKVNRTAWQWRMYDGYVIQKMLVQLLPYFIGEKGKQARSFARFVQEKLRVYEERQADGRHRYSDSECLWLFYLARDARNYALGRGGTWRERWAGYIKELEATVGEDTVRTFQQAVHPSFDLSSFDLS